MICQQRFMEKVANESHMKLYAIVVKPPDMCDLIKLLTDGRKIIWTKVQNTRI